jgi:hypothetical protein
MEHPEMTDEERAINQFLDYLWDSEDFTILPPHPPEGWAKRKEATFMGTLGMGDLILACPAAVYAMQYYETVYFPCKEEQERSVREFFRLYEGRISVNVLRNKSEINGESIVEYDEKDKHGDRLSWSGSARSNISFSESAYERLGVPYSARWKYDPIPEAASIYLDGGWEKRDEYTFVHQDPKRGYAIKGKYLDDNCVYPTGDESVSILSYAPAIRHAKRIKVIDSCFLHLCESLPTRTDAVLEYHKYAKPLEDRVNDIDVPTRKNWKVILE